MVRAGYLGGALALGAFAATGILLSNPRPLPQQPITSATQEPTAVTASYSLDERVRTTIPSTQPEVAAPLPPEDHQAYIDRLFEPDSGSPFSLVTRDYAEKFQLPTQKHFATVYASMFGDVADQTLGDLATSLQQLPQDHPLRTTHRPQLEELLGTTLEDAVNLPQERAGMYVGELSSPPDKEYLSGLWNEQTQQTFVTIREDDLLRRMTEEFIARDAYRIRDNATALEAPRPIAEDLLPFKQEHIFDRFGYASGMQLWEAINHYGQRVIEESVGDCTQKDLEASRLKLRGIFNKRQEELGATIQDPTFQLYNRLFWTFGF